MEDPMPKSKRRQRIEKKLEDSEKQEQHCKGQVGGIVPQFFFSIASGMIFKYYLYSKCLVSNLSCCGQQI
jgi:hypothetical protein